MSEIKMILARGPSGEIVNVLKKDHFEKWHGRGQGGLRCLNYNHPVTVKLRRDTGTRFLSHIRNGGVDRDDREPAEPQYMRVLLTEWLRDMLEKRHFAVKDAPDSKLFDLLVEHQNKRIAIKVQMNVSSTNTELNQRTQSEINQEILAAGYEPLWITEHTRWGGSIQAVSFKQYNQSPGPSYRVSEVYDRMIGVDQGILTFGQNIESPSSPGLQHLQAASLPWEEILPGIITGRYTFLEGSSLRGFIDADELNSYAQALRERNRTLHAQLAAFEAESSTLKAGLSASKVRQSNIEYQLEHERQQSKHQAKLHDEVQAKLSQATEWAECIENLRDQNAVARTILQKTPALFASAPDQQHGFWQRLWPWLMVTALFLGSVAIPFITDHFLKLPLFWKPVCVIASGVILAALSLWLIFGWCWATESGLRVRCRRRRAYPFGRCKYQRTHALNRFDVIGLALFGASILAMWWILIH